jgi:hypothetical protein
VEDRADAKRPAKIAEFKRGVESTLWKDAGGLS